MWTRADLKARAKVDFKKNYWACVLVSFILAILVGGGSGASNAYSSYNNITNTSSSSYDDDYDYDYDDDYDSYDDDYDYDDSYSDSNPISEFASSPAYGAFVAVGMAIGLLLFAVAVAFGLFVANPLVVGGRRFYLENQYENGKLNRLGFIFKKGYYGNTVLTMFLKDLFIGLWSLLFIIPGVVKSYSYWMMEYMLAENPNLSHERAFEISKQTMNGQKWDVFVLDLSFILWGMLSTITCGLVGIFYVNSYVDATKAQLYGFLRMIALNTGVATPDELPGYFPQVQQNPYQGQTYQEPQGQTYQYQQPQSPQNQTCQDQQPQDSTHQYQATQAQTQYQAPTPTATPDVPQATPETPQTPEDMQ